MREEIMRYLSRCFNLGCISPRKKLKKTKEHISKKKCDKKDWIEYGLTATPSDYEELLQNISCGLRIVNKIMVARNPAEAITIEEIYRDTFDVFISSTLSTEIDHTDYLIDDY